MFTRETKKIVQKITVLVMLFSIVQSSWAGLNLKLNDNELRVAKLAY